MFSKSNPLQSEEMAMPSSADNFSSAAPADSSVTFSVFGPDVTVRGDIDASVDLHIDGTVEGDIRCAVLIQGANSTIKGGIIADQARIAGTIEGSVAAKEIIIESSSRVTGDVVYEKLSVASGSRIEGSFKHKSTGTIRAEDAGLKLIENTPEPEPAAVKSSNY